MKRPPYLRTSLGLLNFCFFQWYWIRLARVGREGRHYGLIVGVVPLTGWWSNYVPRHPWLIEPPRRV